MTHYTSLFLIGILYGVIMTLGINAGPPDLTLMLFEESRLGELQNSFWMFGEAPYTPITLVCGVIGLGIHTLRKHSHTWIKSILCVIGLLICSMFMFLAMGYTGMYDIYSLVWRGTTLALGLYGCVIFMFYLLLQQKA